MKLGCKDVGLDCEFVATGNSASEVRERLNTHAKEAHSAMMEAIDRDEMKWLSMRIGEKLAKQG